MDRSPLPDSRLKKNNPKISRDYPNLSRCNAREISFLSLLKAFQGGGFILDTLDEWNQKAHPSSADYRFAQELSYGTCRMALALDYLASQLANKKKLTLKLKERVLLRLAFYQCFYMDKVPIYAAVDESIALAHQYCHPSFADFLNAILRKSTHFKPVLPAGLQISTLSVRYSYPEFFVSNLINEYGVNKAIEIMEAGNVPSSIMVRVRALKSREALIAHSLKIVSPSCPIIAQLEVHSHLAAILQSNEYYVQNITPAFLMNQLSEAWKQEPPEKILDLCSSPGGKLLAAYDQFPFTKLYANDISPNKVHLLASNCAKYQIAAEISCSKGEEYPLSQQFDIVILDVPCSNTGVLNKRPEARWRQSKESLAQLEKIQFELLKHAQKLIKKNGEIWYLTCSILKNENEQMMRKAMVELGMKIKFQKIVLPNLEGWDGGFAAILRNE